EITRQRRKCLEIASCLFRRILGLVLAKHRTVVVQEQARRDEPSMATVALVQGHTTEQKLTLANRSHLKPTTGRRAERIEITAARIRAAAGRRPNEVVPLGKCAFS